jgi:hypothetical protein
MNLNKFFINKMKTNFLKQYDCTPDKFRDKIITNLLTNKSCRLIAIFKESMISDYIEEFLKRFYSLDESLERLPRIANYYRNYSKFFCRPRFGDIAINVLLESNGDFKAELYYKQNYAKKNESFENIETLLTTTVKQEIEENHLTVRKTESLLGNSVSYLNEQVIINSSGLLTAKQSKNTSLIGLIFNLDAKTDKNEKFKKNNKYNISTFDRTKGECQSSKISENKDLKDKTNNIEKIEKIVISNKAISNVKLGFEEKSRNQRKSFDKTASVVKTNISTAKGRNTNTVIKTTTSPLMPKYSFRTINIGKQLTKVSSTSSKQKIVLSKPNLDKLTMQISKMGKEQINKLVKKESSLKINQTSLNKTNKLTSKSKDKIEFMTMNMAPNESKDVKITSYYKNIYSSRNTSNYINIKKTSSTSKKPLINKKSSLEYKNIEIAEINNKSKNENNNKILYKQSRNLKVSGLSKGENSIENRIYNTYNYINSIGAKKTNITTQIVKGPILANNINKLSKFSPCKLDLKLKLKKQ